MLGSFLITSHELAHTILKDKHMDQISPSSNSTYKKSEKKKKGKVSPRLVNVDKIWEQNCETQVQIQEV